MRIFTYLGLVAALLRPCFAQVAPEEIAVHARVAQKAQADKDFLTAIREYELLARWLPQTAEVQSNLGVALYFNNDTMRAISSFRRAIDINPNLATPHLFTGLAWYRLSNPDAAAPELEKAVAINGSDAVARTWLGYAYVEQSRYDVAAKQFKAASNLDENNIDVWYGLGQSLLQLGKEATVKLLAVAPDGGRAWQLAGDQFQLHKDSERALALFEGALERRPDLIEVAEAVRSLGGIPKTAGNAPHTGSLSEEDALYRQAHDYEQSARESFAHVASLAPDSYRAHQILADSYAAQQRSDDAIAEYRTVLRLKPGLPGVHELIGNTLLSVAKTSEALKEYESELQIQPHSSTAHMNVARALVLLGDDERAEKMLKEALSFNRPPLEVYKLLGKIDLHRHDYRPAIEALTHYVKTTKDDSSAYYLLLQAYRSIGDSDGVRRAAASYEKTSQDAKNRSNAQKGLQGARYDDSPEVAQSTSVAQPLR